MERASENQECTVQYGSHSHISQIKFRIHFLNHTSNTALSTLSIIWTTTDAEHFYHYTTFCWTSLK